MASSDSSFDVVSKVDMQEVKNAVDQALREIDTRFDFKGSESTIELDEKKNTISMASDNETRMKALIDVLETKFHKRGLDIKALELGKIEDASKGTVRQSATIRQGLDTDTCRKIAKIIKDKGLKVQSAIQGDTVRVSGKVRDDLQAIMAALKASDIDVPLQFINYR